VLPGVAEWLLELELDGWQLVDPLVGGRGRVVNENGEKRLYNSA
jgi:hypothetical protein